MRSIEKTGKTVDDAITDALIELGASTDQVNIEIISKGSKGILGIGAKEARVKVTLKEVPQEPVYQDIIEKFEEKVVEPKRDLVQEEVVPVKDSEDSVVVTKEELNDVIDRAKRFLNKIFKEMNIEAVIEEHIVNDNRITLVLKGKNMGMVIGKRGETLDAIQYLVNIVANKERTQYIKIMLDTENYRARREETLKKLAYKLAKKADQTKHPVILEPMNPYDRRIIHSALQENKYVKTHSEGKEPFRRVVITPNYPNRTHKKTQ